MAEVAKRNGGSVRVLRVWRDFTLLSLISKRKMTWRHGNTFRIIKEFFDALYIIRPNKMLNKLYNTIAGEVRRYYTYVALLEWWARQHYNDVIMSKIASQITCLTIVYSTVYPGADHKKHQSSASLAFVRGIHRRPVKSPHKGPVTRKMPPFDDVIMKGSWDKAVNYWYACCRWNIIEWTITTFGG